MTDPTFATILADPNWIYSNYGAKKHGAARAHYAGSAVEVISAVPVARWARRDSVLLLWSTLPKVDQAVDVLRAWGFSLVTAVPWIKTSPNSGEIRRGIGFWFQSAAELLLICRRGKARGPRQTQHERMLGLLVREARVFCAPRGPHSRKPLSLVEWIESRLPGPRLELWASSRRPGWTSWGERTGHWLCPEGVIPLKQAQLEGLAPLRR